MFHSDSACKAGPGRRNQRRRARTSPVTAGYSAPHEDESTRECVTMALRLACWEHPDFSEGHITTQFCLVAWETV